MNAKDVVVDFQQEVGEVLGGVVGDLEMQEVHLSASSTECSLDHHTRLLALS